MLCSRCYPFSTGLSLGPVTGLPAWNSSRWFFSRRLIWSGHYPIYKIHFCDFSSSLEENVNSSMDNAPASPAMAWFHDLFVLLLMLFFTVYLFCLSTLPGPSLSSARVPGSYPSLGYSWVPLTSGPCSSSPIITKVMVLIL